MADVEVASTTTPLVDIDSKNEEEEHEGALARIGY